MAITKVSPGLLDLDSGITITVTDNSDNLTLVSTDADANVGPNLNLYRNSGSPADSDVLGVVTFNGRNDNSQDVIYARQLSYITDASDGTEDGTFKLQTMVGGTIRDRLNITPSEINLNEDSQDVDFRVESNGNANGLILRGSDGAVGISTSPNAWETGTGGRQPIQVGFGSISGRLNDLHTEFTNNAYAVGTGNSPQWAGITRWSKNQIALGSGGQIYFNTSPTVAENTFNSSPNFSWTNMLTLESTGATLANGLTLTDGDLTVASGHGINFAATGGPTNGSGNSELFDDYEEGTFTPVYQDYSDNAITNQTSTVGRYTKVGRFVYVMGALRTQSSSDASGLSGNLRIGGMPFTAVSVSANGMATFYTHQTATSYNAPDELPRSSPFAANGTAIHLRKYAGTGGRTVLFEVSDLNMSGNSNYMFFSGTYEVA